MSRKLVSQIKDIKGLSGRHKRVLEAWAAFANNDGTNIFASKEKVAKKASIGRSTVYHNTEDLITAGILVQAKCHTCKIESCNKGGTHFTGKHGQYTVAYDISLPALQNEETYLLLNRIKVGVPKQLNLFVQNRTRVPVPKLDATQALEETPAPLGRTEDSSALTSGNEGSEVRKEPPSFASLTTAESSVSSLASLENQNHNGSGDEAEQDQDQSQKQPHPPERQTKLEEYLKYFGSEEDIQAVVEYWYAVTTLEDAYHHKEEIAGLYLEDFSLREHLKLILKDCPQTAKVVWRDFEYFVKNYKRTLRNALAWKRGQDAVMVAKAETSKHGACLICKIRPATAKQGVYSDQHCAECGTARRRARNLLDAAESTTGYIWSYQNKPELGHWIGGDNGELKLYGWRHGATYEEKLNGLVEAGDAVMDAIEKLLGRDLVPVG